MQRIAVACSGGRDSMALLYATARMAQALGGIEVLALHVHHGLSPQADAWLAVLEREKDGQVLRRGFSPAMLSPGVSRGGANVMLGWLHSLDDSSQWRDGQARFSNPAVFNQLFKPQFGAP